jgi:hypothetical protein
VLFVYLIAVGAPPRPPLYLAIEIQGSQIHDVWRSGTCVDPVDKLLAQQGAWATEQGGEVVFTRRKGGKRGSCVQEEVLSVWRVHELLLSSADKSVLEASRVLIPQ